MASHENGMMYQQTVAENKHVAVEEIYSFCRIQKSLGIPHFENPEDVYVGLAEDEITMDKFLKNTLPHVSSVEEVVSVIGGMSVLHLLPSLDVSTVKSFHWFDVNCHALDNAQLILALIVASNSRNDFIRRIFARDVKKFLEDFGYHELTISNQHEYMKLEPDSLILEDTLSALSEKLKRVYKQNIIPRAHEGPIPTDIMANQHSLSPMLQNGTGALTRVGKKNVLNRGSYDYGFGFMSNDEAFNKTREIILSAQHKFSVASLLDSGFSWSDGAYETLLYTSNVLSFAKLATVDLQHMVISWWKPYFANHRALHILSVFPLPDFQVPRQNENYVQIGNGLRPHVNAFYYLASFIDIGSTIVEVMKKELLPGGMREFPRTAVSVDKYQTLEKCEAHTTILHILVGEGAVSKDELLSLFRRALEQSTKVVVMEWDATSADHIDKRDGLFSPEEFTERAGQPLLKQLHVPGLYDDRRIFILEYSGMLEQSLFVQPTCSIAI